jgi:hypothetical protein
MAAPSRPSRRADAERWDEDYEAEVAAAIERANAREE